MTQPQPSRMPLLAACQRGQKMKLLRRSVALALARQGCQ
jgi:hypothetical protein